MIIAKLKVNSVTPSNVPQADGTELKTGESVSLSAVYSEDPACENYCFSQATPSAEFSMFISNPNAFGFYEVGKEYIFQITPAE